MRTFRDRAGTEWTLFEVKKQTAAEGQVGYLPRDFGNGWLCFESQSSKRRLSPVPEGWDALDDGALSGLLQDAQPVTRRFNGLEGGGGWTTEEPDLSP